MASGQEVAKLVVSVTADLSGLERGLAEARAQTSALGGRLTESSVAAEAMAASGGRAGAAVREVGAGAATASAQVRGHGQAHAEASGHVNTHAAALSTLGFSARESAELLAQPRAASFLLSDALLGIGPAAVAAGAGFAAFEAVSGAVERTTELGHATLVLQSIMGGSTEDASRLIATFDRFGLSSEQAGVMLGVFSRHLQGVEDPMDGVGVGAKSSAEAFAELGVQTKDTSGTLRPTAEIMLDVADGFSRMQDGAEKTSIAMALFGRSGRDIIFPLNQGREGMQEAMEAAQKYGLVLSQENVAQIHEFMMAQKDLSEASTGLALAVGTTLVPTLSAVEHALAGGVTGARDFGPALGSVGSALSDLGGHWNDLPLPLRLFLAGPVASAVATTPAVARAAVGAFQEGGVFGPTASKEEGRGRFLQGIGARDSEGQPLDPLAVGAEVDALGQQGAALQASTGFLLSNEIALSHHAAREIEDATASRELGKAWSSAADDAQRFAEGTQLAIRGLAQQAAIGETAAALGQAHTAVTLLTGGLDALGKTGSQAFGGLLGGATALTDELKQASGVAGRLLAGAGGDAAKAVGGLGGAIGALGSQEAQRRIAEGKRTADELKRQEDEAARRADLLFGRSQAAARAGVSNLGLWEQIGGMHTPAADKAAEERAIQDVERERMLSQIDLAAAQRDGDAQAIARLKERIGLYDAEIARIKALGVAKAQEAGQGGSYALLGGIPRHTTLDPYHLYGPGGTASPETNLPALPPKPTVAGDHIENTTIQELHINVQTATEPDVLQALSAALKRRRATPPALAPA